VDSSAGFVSKMNEIKMFIFLPENSKRLTIQYIYVIVNMGKSARFPRRPAVAIRRAAFSRLSRGADRKSQEADMT
jgi:hypothetical protein